MSEQNESPLRRFLAELQRRRVWQTAGFYLAGGWLLLQVMDTALVQIGFPRWANAVAVWLLFLSFPIVLLVSWMYQIGRDGVRRTAPAVPAGAPGLSLRIADYFVIGLSLVLIVAMGVALSRLLQAEHPQAAYREARENSIAVLPFENMDGRPEDDYLGRGLAEDILHRLASTRGLQVASRTASFELDDSKLELAEIARRLGVKSVLEGSVRKDGNRMRIVAQLIDAETGFHLWSGSYDRVMADLFSVYDEISTAVADELQLTLAPGDTQKSEPPTADMQAYDYFLQARSMLQRSASAASTANAQGFFAKAVQHDPGFAQAWAGQCQAYLDWYYFEPAVNKIENAEASCLKALELRPDLLEGRVALGDLYRKTGRLDDSIAEYQAALQVNRESAITWTGLGQALAERQSDREAEDAMKHAIELDPNDLRGLTALGGFYFARGRYNEAVETYRQLVNHPNATPSAYNSLGAALYMHGDFEPAAEAYRKVVANEPSAGAYSNIGIMYFYDGQYADAAVMYREAIALAPENPVFWGNLADCLLEIEGGHEEAQLAYRTAAGLAEKLLPANPENAELLTNLAHYNARLGDDEKARQFIAHALAAAPDDVYAHYYAALVHLQAGRREQALAEITRAVELGYPRVLLAPDPQFASLHEEERFRGLLAAPEGKDGN